MQTFFVFMSALSVVLFKFGECFAEVIFVKLDVVVVSLGTILFRLWRNE